MREKVAAIAHFVNLANGFPGPYGDLICRPSAAENQGEMDSNLIADTQFCSFRSYADKILDILYLR